MIPQSITGWRAASAPAMASCELGVVSTGPALGLWIQQQLDRAAPRLYRVTQRETRSDLEATLWEAAQPQQRWAALLIDITCPTLQDVPRAFYTWLAWFTHPIALLDATITRPEQVQALLDLGFHAWLPVEAGGGYMHVLLSWLLRLDPAAGAGTDVPQSRARQREQRCLVCYTVLPASAQFCAACGTPLPARRPSITRVLAPWQDTTGTVRGENVSGSARQPGIQRDNQGP